MTAPPRPNPEHLTPPRFAHVNTRATAAWAATLLRRMSAVLIGSSHPGWLWTAEMTDDSCVDLIELGERVCEYLPFPSAVPIGVSLL